MKKLICLLMALLLACCLPALAEDVWDFDEDYCELSGYAGAGGDVIVPGEIGSSTVDVIQTNTFSNTDAIASLTLPDTVLQLKDSAIYWCEKLTAVSLPDSLIAIGERNLRSCPMLTEVTIPAGVRFIGEAAFSADEALRKIVFEGVCPIIESDCFTELPADTVIFTPDDQLEAYRAALTAAGCTAAVQPSGKNAVIVDNNGFNEDDFDFDPATGTIISYNAYATYLVIPETIGGVPVKAIGDEAFQFHYYLAVLELPEGLETIGSRAFAHCETLQYVSFPDSLKTIGAEAFNGGYKARKLNLSHVETIGDGAFKFSRITGEVTLPEGLTAIGANAFESNSYITSIALPATLTSIGDYAFNNDWSLEYVALPSLNPPALGENAFSGCSALADLDLNEHCTKTQALAVQAYMDAQGLSCYVWRAQNSQSDYPEDGTSVYENGLMTAYTGAQTRIHPYDICDSVQTIGLADGLFKDNQTLEYFAVPHSDKFTTIGAEAFMGSAIQGVDLFDSVTTIGERAFANCAQLEELTLPESVTSIGAGAFEGLTGLKKLTVLCDASLIPEGSFADCAGLADVRLSAGATDAQIADWNQKLNRPWYDPILRVGEASALVKMPFAPTPAEYFDFNPATGLISAYTGTDVDVVVPREIGGVTVVGFEGYNAFASCQDFTNTETPTNQTEWVHLRTLVLPETIREIPDSLLMYCQQLENFICYAPVESTGKSTFVLCRSLKNVAFMNGVRVIDSYAFDSTDSLESLYFGAHVQKIAANAFNFSGLTSFVVDAEVIETGAFTDCKNLTSLHFTKKVKTIGETFAMECDSLNELCFDCNLTQGLLLLNAAPQLTVRVAADADAGTRSLAQNCMSWSEKPSEITVTSEKCMHTLPARPDALALLPGLAADQAIETIPQTEPKTTTVPAVPVEPTAPPAPQEAPVFAAQSAAVPEGYLGTWYGVSMDLEGTLYALSDLGLDAMLTINADGTVTLTMNGDVDSTQCTVQDGVLMLDGVALRIEDGSLIYAEEGMIMTLSREKPQAAEAAPVDESATLDSYQGVWAAVKVTADGATIPADITEMAGDTLTVHGKTCDITFSGTLIDGLACHMEGSALIFSLMDSDAIATLRTDGTLALDMLGMTAWYERTGDAPAELPTDAPKEAAADVVWQKFVIVSYEAAGQTYAWNPIMGEYSMTLHADGTVSFVIGGNNIPGLAWRMEGQQYIIDSYGTLSPLVMTDAGFDFNYMGMMLMHFVPANS